MDDDLSDKTDDNTSDKIESASDYAFDKKILEFQ